MSTIILKPGKDRRLRAGHCWVYAGEVAGIEGAPADGAEVEIRDHRQRHLGRGLINAQSQILVRRFTLQEAPLDESFFRRRLESAIAYRRRLGAQTTARLVFSEADQLPGLIVDQFEDQLVLQALTLGIDQRKPMLVRLLREFCQPRSILERSDAPTRRLEGLAETKGLLHGPVAESCSIGLGGVRFAVNLLEDQKTGFFLDQVQNYQIVGAAAAGQRVLDCFSYHGGFALFAAQAGAASIQAIEISAPAVERARRNAELNGWAEKIQFDCANAFDQLKQYDAQKRQFDLIVLDPPTFTRTKQNIDDALRGYKEINLRALKMLPPGGLLATFTCSHHIRAELFLAAVLAAAADARKLVRLRQRLTQAPDHPILPAVPETEYLKGLLLEVI